MKTLRQCLAEAREKGVAIGHFNISNLEGLWAIFRAAQGLGVPVIIGVSEGERDFVGVRQVAALVKSIRQEFTAPGNPNEPYPIFLNADHTYSFDRVKEAIDAGFDSVIFDGAKLPLEENIVETKKCVEYARRRAELEGREIIVEGELGYIGQSSKILDAIPEGVSTVGEGLTTIAEAEQFVRETGVDLLAPAVGNVHGMLKGGADPRLDIDKIQAISAACPTLGGLVLHGASGNTDEDIKAAIAAGVRIVHINTELRVAYRDGLKLSLQANPEEVAPYKITKPALLAMQQVVERKLRVFANI